MRRARCCAVSGKSLRAEILGAQHNAFCEAFDRSLQLLLACESKLIMVMHVFKTKLGELKMSLNSSAPCACCLEGTISELKAVHAEKFELQPVAWLPISPSE